MFYNQPPPPPPPHGFNIPSMKPPNYYQNPQNYPQQSHQPMNGYHHYPQTQNIVVIENNRGRGGC